MYNCLLDDTNYNLTVKLLSWVKQDGNGYFMDLRIKRTDVVPLMELGITPRYTEDGLFYIRVHISNKTFFSINGIRLYNLDSTSSKDVKLSKIQIKQLYLKIYSKRTKSKRDCYAVRMIFNTRTRNKKRSK